MLCSELLSHGDLRSYLQEIDLRCVQCYYLSVCVSIIKSKESYVVKAIYVVICASGQYNQIADQDHEFTHTTQSALQSTLWISLCMCTL